jgi:PhnB protein
MNKYHTINTWIVTKNSDQMIEFLKVAFNGVELGRVYNNDGTIGHAEVQIGDSKILLFDAKPILREIPAFVFLYVDNGDILYEQALKAGAVSITKMTTHSWGDRVGRVQDPFGNIWWITTPIEELTSDEIVERSMQKEFIEAMEYAQNSFNEFIEKEMTFL